MCWINWFIKSWISIDDSKTLLKNMNKKIAHRWPDDEWFFVDTFQNKTIGLWQVRLSILDLSPAWHQPMFYKKEIGASNDNHKLFENTDLAIVFNGEIYNYGDIKDDLWKKWYHFTTKCDTEVILASYLEYWENCVNIFNGMWAFVIYDKINNKIFASRDRLGKKPFYYFFNWENFIFSSEIKWILETGVEKIFNSNILSEFLMFHYTPWKETLIKDIIKLPAAHNITYDLNKNIFNIIPYWDIKNDTILFQDFQLAQKQLDTLLNDSVKIRTETSDVPVWTFLSWWLDSSLISALFKKYYTWKEFHTFNVIWEDSIKNESKYAEIVSNHIWSTHHKFKVTWKDVLDNIYELQKYYSDPISEAGYIPNFFVSKYAHEYVKVVLTWDGADEVFGWYEYYVFLEKLWNIWKIPLVKSISSLLWKLLPPSKIQKGFELLSYASKEHFDSFFGLTISNFSHKELQKLVTYKVNKSIVFKDIKKTIKDFSSFLNQLLYTDQKILLEQCYNLKPDNALMWNGIEWRSPMQDYRLVEFAYTIPDSFKINKWKEKYILTEVAKKYLPQEIFERKKQWYWVPIYEWINHELKDIVKQKLNNSILEKKWYLNKNQINFYLDNIENKYFSTRIWNIFSLELYIEVYELTIA